MLEVFSMFSFSEKWYGNSWKDVELVLYTDTVLAWHDEVCCISVYVFQVYVLLQGGEMVGGAKLVNSPDLIAAGQYTSNIPDRPDPPSGYSSGESGSINNNTHSFIVRSTDSCRHQAKQQGTP